MRTMGLAALVVIVLAVAAAPTLARGDRAAERFAVQALNAAQNAERAVDQTQSAARDANRGTVGDANKGVAVADGGISVGNVVLLALIGSALVVGAWCFPRRAMR